MHFTLHQTGVLFWVTRYCGSFSTYVDENIEKATTEAGMVFSANFDRRKTNPFVYIKFWKQVCLPSLLFGVELYSLNKTLVEKLDVSVGF